MEYKKPMKLLPLQAFLAFNNLKKNDTKSEEPNPSLPANTSQQKIMDSCVKSFSRLYYQSTIKHSSFHHSKITGKVREEIPPASLPNTSFSSASVSEKKSDYKLSSIKEETENEIIKKNKIISKLINRKNKAEKKILQNGPDRIKWETRLTTLELESMKICVEGVEGCIYVPITHLKYIIFNTKEKIQQLVQKFLRVGSRLEWKFYKKKSRTRLKNSNISCIYPFVTENEKIDSFPPIIQFQLYAIKDLNTLELNESKRAILLLPRLIYKTDKFERNTLVSLNNLKTLLKKSQALNRTNV